ncbi:MAG: hypothetical protein ACI4TE_09420 [Alphaproteobacteria bacterium]
MTIIYALNKIVCRAAKAVIRHTCAEKEIALPDIIRKTGRVINAMTAAQNVPARRHIAPNATPDTIPITDNVQAARTAANHVRQQDAAHANPDTILAAANA